MKPDFEETKRKAEAGDAEALYNLGTSCERGRGVPQSDEEAACWSARPPSAATGAPQAIWPA